MSYPHVHRGEHPGKFLLPLKEQTRPDGVYAPPPCCAVAFALSACTNLCEQNFAMLQHVPELQGPVLTIAPRASGGHTATATAVDWFPTDSGAFLSASKDSTAKLWDSNAGALVAEFATATPSHSMRMAPSAHPVAAVGCDDGCIRLLDIAAGVTCNTLMGMRFDPPMHV